MAKKIAINLGLVERVPDHILICLNQAFSDPLYIDSAFLYEPVPKVDSLDNGDAHLFVVQYLGFKIGLGESEASFSCEAYCKKLKLITDHYVFNSAKGIKSLNKEDLAIVIAQQTVRASLDDLDFYRTTGIHRPLAQSNNNTTTRLIASAFDGWRAGGGKL